MMNFNRIETTKEAFTSVWKEKGEAPTLEELDLLLRQVHEKSAKAHCPAISGVADPGWARSAQIVALCVAEAYSTKFQKAVVKVRDQSEKHRFVDIWGRVLSCGALSLEMEQRPVGTERDAAYAALNRALQQALSALLLEAEKGRYALGDKQPLRWAFKLVAHDLCSEEVEVALLSDLL